MPKVESGATIMAWFRTHLFRFLLSALRFL